MPPESIDPRRFEFFQLVRLLEHAAARTAQDHGQAALQPVGRDAAPSRECVRFHVPASTAFPASSIQRDDDHPELAPRTAEPTDLDVTFLGLIGASGVLPAHYTNLILQRLRQRDPVLQSFLDLFQHRTISLFYRAWTKNRIALHFEQAQLAGNNTDAFAEGVFAFAGFGFPSLRKRTSNPDALFLQFAGLFAQRPRTALSLQRMLSASFGLPITVRQFCGRWLSIARHDRTRLPDADNRLGQFHELGSNAILGDQLWDCQTKFRLILGPLDRQQFRDWMPTEQRLQQLGDLTRSYVGPELDFDVQVEIRSEAAPDCCVWSADEPHPVRLGWDTWLGTCESGQVLSDAVFSLSAEDHD